MNDDITDLVAFLLSLGISLIVMMAIFAYLFVLIELIVIWRSNIITAKKIAWSLILVVPVIGLLAYIKQHKYHGNTPGTVIRKWNW